MKYCSAGDHTLKKEELIEFKSHLERGFKITFKFKPAAVGPGNIIQGIGNGYGKKVTAVLVYLIKGTTRLKICTVMNGEKNYCPETVHSIHLDKFNSITVQQLQVESRAHYDFQVFINGERALRTSNFEPWTFQDVKFYASAPRDSPANGIIQDFKIETYKHMGKR